MWRHGPKDDATSSADKNDLGFNAPRAGGGATKRYSHPENTRISAGDGIRQLDRRPRHRLHPSRAHGGARKGFACRGAYHFYILVTICIVLFIGAAWLHIWVSGGGLGPGGLIRGVSQGRKPFQGDLKFVPVNLLKRFAEQGGIDRIRSEPRFGVRPPRLAIVLGNLKKDPSSLMLLTLAKSLKELGYDLTVFAIKDGEAHSLWHLIGCQISIFGPENTGYADWSIFEGIISSSLEAKEVISSLMLKPFESIPLVWIIEEDTLGKRLQLYEEMGAQHIIAEWRSAFKRADVVVFPDFSLPMLYTALDTGNFFVISGSPVDVWAAESYIMSNSRYELRKDNGFHEDDLVILVIGSYFFYDEFLWGFPTAMHAIGSRLKKLATVKNLGGSFKFVFLCGNSSDAHGAAFQEFALHLGFPDHSVRHYGMDGDVNSVLLMADTVLYGSFQDEQSFPPLLMRAMSFKIPIIAPDLPIIKKYVVDKVHGMLFQARNPETLTRALALLISDIKLSQLAYVVADYGRSHSKNMLAWGCISGYVKLLENVIQFPSDAFLPGPISQLQQRTWEWNLFADEIGKISSGMQQSSIVYSIEEELADMNTVKNSSDGSKNEIETLMQDSPTELDWQDIMEIEISEDFERREMQELDERIEKTSGPWDDIYRKARKAEKMKFEANERDEGELERTGQPLCIYEIYSGPGAWQFLHHSALYRGISLSKGARRSRSDDVDAVGRLRLLNETYYRDLLCEMGGMLSIANRVDKIHKIPWIGFQSWRAAGRKVSLSIEAEKVLEETIQNETKGDVIYYWARMDMQSANVNGNHDFNFWSMCDVLNGGNCRSVFADAFRQMYGLPNDMAAVPPMPSNGDHWSSLHSWVMPTPSFLEFVMFSRMFVDALDNLNRNSSSNRHSCLLGSSKLEKRHCYCRVLELLVNVWAFHSARKMIYLDPVSGELKEQHRIEQRKGVMWAKFFNFTLLKSMDEDFAEEADDGIHPSDRWLWPLTGEVHWQGIFEREREERYRLKKDKHRKNQEKIIERQKFGYKQKTLGGRR